MGTKVLSSVLSQGKMQLSFLPKLHLLDALSSKEKAIYGYGLVESCYRMANKRNHRDR